MTDRQTAAYLKLKNYLMNSNTSITTREFCKLINVKSSSTGYKYLKIFKDNGLIGWDGKSRGIYLIKEAEA